MSLKNTVFFLLALFLLTTCVQEAPSTQATAEHVAPTDSFSIDRTTFGRRELSNLLWMNDSTLFSFDSFDDLYFYRKHGPVFSYSANVKLLPENHSVGSVSLSKDGRKLYRLRKKTIYTYSLDGQLKDSITINASLPVLKEEFFVGCCNFLPFLQFGDTLVAYYSHSDANDLFKTYEEDAFLQLIPQKNGTVTTKTLLKKPSELEFYEVLPYLFHCAVNRTLYKMYNGLDTVYSYNLSTGAEGAVSIGNRDYRLPERADLNKLFEPAYSAKRSLANFAYCGFFHNPVTGHFVLFYSCPVLAKPGKNPTSEDVVIKALVLNTDLSILRYLDFQERYFPPLSYIHWPGKGLAMPVYTKDPTNAPIRYHIYNF